MGPAGTALNRAGRGERCPLLLANAAHPVPFVSSVTANASAVCVTATSGLPTCGGTVNNAVSLTQTGTVPTYFIRVLGIDSWTVSAKATAAKAGGPTKAMNIMFVLDTTASMQTTTDDTGCKVPGIGSPTKLDCAKYGVQLILKQLDPAIRSSGTHGVSRHVRHLDALRRSTRFASQNRGLRHDRASSIRSTAQFQ